MRMSKKFCRLFLPLLCFVLLLSPLTASARAASDVTARLRPDVTIIIDGSKRIFYNVNGQQVHPLSYAGTTYLPLRAIGELMGKVVTWNQNTKTATLSGTRTDAPTTGKPDTRAQPRDVTAGLRDDFTVVVDGTVCAFADANGNTVYPLLYQGSTYLPVRAIGELMGKTVDWDGKTNTVTLSGSEVTDADVIVDGGTKPDTTPGSGNNPLTAEQAKSKALAQEGIDAEDAVFTKTQLEWDDGRQIYDLEFYANGYKYEYEIDAGTGEVLSFEVASSTPPNTAGSLISKEKAQEIALAKVPGATADHIRKLKLDRDDEKHIYEVEIFYNGAEYEIDIDAATGKIVDYDVDYD